MSESPISPALSPWFEVVPIPIWPLSLLPQQATSELSRSAQVKPSPAVIWVAVLPDGRATWTRLSPISPGWSPMVVVDSIPSWPCALDPQQVTVPSTNRMHVWSQPRAREAGADVADEWLAAIMGSPSPISSGESPMSEVLPVPSCPWLLSPQQVMSWLSRMAQVCLWPASMCSIVLPVGRGR